VDALERSAIAHAGLVFQNPLDVHKVDAFVERLPLAPGARVVDLGCGKGELLLRILERHDVSAVGVDLSPYFLADARREAARRVPDARLRLSEEDARQIELDPQSFDLAIAVGAGGMGRHRDALRALARLVRPGGHILLGEGYWRREPSAAYLAALGAARDKLADYEGLVAAAREEGLGLVDSLESTEGDWERYERRWAENGERWAAEHGGHPGRDELLAWTRNGRDRFERLGGRGTLGFALLLLRRPPRRAPSPGSARAPARERAGGGSSRPRRSSQSGARPARSGPESRPARRSHHRPLGG
jgi:SAM-dependent methyltransferase